LSGEDVPKLFIDTEPGSISGDRLRETVRSWPHLNEVTVRGSHFVQEDSGPEIGRAIATWLQTI
jgi:haloalkane dehalogenase